MIIIKVSLFAELTERAVKKAQLKYDFKANGIADSELMY
jgi:hypothetical protein